jgi:DNA-binding NarL/FixJ family response regulator
VPEKRRTEQKRRGDSGGTPAPQRKKIRVAIVDGNPVCRRGLRLLLIDHGHEVVAELEREGAAFEEILKLKPDVAILDSNGPGEGSLELALLLKAGAAATPVVILASHGDEAAFNRAISLGVKGYVLKKSSEREILECIRAAASGEAYVSPALTNLLLRRRSDTDKVRREQPGLGRLTTGERRILSRIAQGKTSRQIATECGISLRTVDSHRANISEKLELRGRNRLLQFALEHRDALSHLD